MHRTPHGLSAVEGIKPSPESTSLSSCGFLWTSHVPLRQIEITLQNIIGQSFRFPYLSQESPIFVKNMLTLRHSNTEHGFPITRLTGCNIKRLEYNVYINLGGETTAILRDHYLFVTGRQTPVHQRVTSSNIFFSSCVLPVDTNTPNGAYRIRTCSTRIQNK